MSRDGLHVLIIGASGTFGSRLVGLLSDEAGLTLTLAARRSTPLRALVDEWSAGRTQMRIKTLDRRSRLDTQIETRPDIIVDASGPFQTTDMRVVDYALTQGVAYLDLSDSPDFTLAIVARDAEATAAGVALISGLSTLPALSQAAIGELAQGRRVTHFAAGIAPGPEVEIGRGVMGAITYQAGERSVTVREGGQARRIAGLVPWQSRTHRIHVPGETPLPRLRFLPVEAPDPVLMEVDGAWCGAAIRPQWQQMIFSALASLRAARLLPSLRPFTKLLRRIHSVTRWPVTERRGGMFVVAGGDDWSGEWHLSAAGDIGPNIPAIPAAIVIKRCLAGETLPPGARAGHMAFGPSLTLDDFAELFAALGIRHGSRQEERDVYPAAMGSDYATLAPALQRFHRVGEAARFCGKATIRRGRHPLGRFVATMFRFPREGRDVPLRVDLHRQGGREIWTRHFGGHRMRSTQEAAGGLINERFGPFRIDLLPVAKDGQMHLRPQGWAVFGCPLPRTLAPGGTIYETERDGRFHFHVDITAPFLGRLVFYEGWLARDDLTE